MVQTAVGGNAVAPGSFTKQLEMAATPMDTAELILNRVPWVLLTAWPQQQGLGSFSGRGEKKTCNYGHQQVPGGLKLSPACLLPKDVFCLLKGTMIPCQHFESYPGLSLIFRHGKNLWELAISS